MFSNKLSLLSLYILFSTITAFAQRVIYVPTDSVTIQGAINQAVDGDTVLVSPGSYSENLDFHGKAITVTSGAKSYMEAAATVLNGVGVVPTISLVTGETRASVLNGFTIQKGASTAVLIHSSATLTNNAIVNNMNCAVVVYGSSSSPLISGNRIAGTLFTTSTCGTADGAAYSGVAVNIDSADDVTLADNLIEDNQASPRGGIVGGAVVSQFNHSITLMGNTIRNNIGATAVVFFSLDDVKVTAVQNLAYGNLARTTDEISGAYAAGGDPGISMTVYSQPSASFTFINNTIVRNYSFGNQSNQDNEQFELAENVQSPRPVMLTAENNIFGGDTAQQVASCSLSSSSTIVWSHNDVYGAGSSAGAPGCTPANASVAGNITDNPSFIDPDNGDFHTRRTSPVVAAGDIYAPLIPPDDLDQRNRTVCGSIDMGVYEVHPIPSIALSSTPNPSVGGSSVSLFGQLTGNCNMPTGTLTFVDGATPLSSVPLTLQANTSYSISNLTVGSHTLTATYPGDFNFDPSTSNPVSQVVTGYPTVTSLQVLPNPAKAFQPITFMAMVTSQFGAPNGTISFYTGSTLLATASVNSSGQASATIRTLGTGKYRITAVYNASVLFASSTSPVVSVEVDGAPTTASLASAPNPSSFGQNVIFTATVAAPQSSSIPSGTVQFMDGAVMLGSVPLSNAGVASLSLTSLSVGSHTITASYTGSQNDEASTSNAVIQVVGVAPTVVTLTSSLNPANLGQAVTFVASVSASNMLSFLTGSVTFADQLGTLATVPLSGGQAVLTTSTLAVGMHTITASYVNTSGNYAGATSGVLSEVIQQFDFAVSVSSPSLTIPTSGYQVVTVTLTPVGGFNHPVALSCASVPLYSQCAFSSSVSSPLSAGPQQIQLVVNTDQLFEFGKEVGSTSKPPSRGNRHPVLWATMLIPLFAFSVRRSSPRSLRRLTLLTVSILLGLSGLEGCSGKQPSSTVPGLYTISVIGTDVSGGSLTHSTNLVLQVTP